MAPINVGDMQGMFCAMSSSILLLTYLSATDLEKSNYYTEALEWMHSKPQRREFLEKFHRADRDQTLIFLAACFMKRDKKAQIADGYCERVAEYWES